MNDLDALFEMTPYGLKCRQCETNYSGRTEAEYHFYTVHFPKIGKTDGWNAGTNPAKPGRYLVTIENQTSADWSDVEVWLNDHYRVTAASLGAKGRLEASLNVFVAGFGQRFDHRRQYVFGLEVTARSARGAPVKLVWGKGRRR